ncbi:MAG TPA: hypothetical protein VM537_19935, partial [Anaerolineae bacterium]|nr:hypothetical protein [Anaerolineae bacterium]
MRVPPMRQLCLLALMVAVTSLLWVGIAVADHVHEADYVWYSTGGSSVSQREPVLESWSYGDITGLSQVKIEEDVWTPEQNQGGPQGAWLFEYHVDGFDVPEDAVLVEGANGGWITSFAVPTGASTSV